MGVTELISRDSFCAPEEKIFECVCEWVRRNQDIHSNAAAVLRGVRLPLMNLNTLLETVRPTGLVEPNLILDAIYNQSKTRDRELRYRGYLGMLTFKQRNEIEEYIKLFESIQIYLLFIMLFYLFRSS